MKKIFLILAVTFCSAALAQDATQLFNAEEYLNNKRSVFNKPKTKSPIKIKPGISHFYAPVSPQAVLSHTLPNGNKVYLLPQDNMPCIMPDMQQLPGIPNAFNGNTNENSIPNPGLRKLPLVPGQK